MENMKKNNVITILIDSMNTKSLGTGRTKVSSTPFIDQLANEGLFANNIFSYGPYTDAATKGLFCGNRTLDDYGYYFGINSSKYNHYKIFKENGYETYGLFYPYYLISTDKQKDIDHHIYTSGFVFSSVWFGKFLYYQNIKKKRELTSDEYLVTGKCLELIFDCWESFYEDILSKEESSILIETLMKKEDVSKSLMMLKQEEKSYLENKTFYIDNLLDKGMDHQLAKIDTINIDGLANREFIKEKVYKKHHQFFKELDKKTVRLNKKNNHFDKGLFKNSVKQLLLKRDRGSLRYLANCYLSRNTVKYQKKNTFKPLWQYESSTMSQINALKNLLDQRNDLDKPFYAFLHLEEPHERISFFSYDINDEKLIDEEITKLTETLNGVDEDFKGSIIYQLSLRYVDICIQKLYEYLEEKKMLDNTTILITADHGSSYSYYPIRKEVVNCFYRENYNVPLVIWQKENIKQKYEGMYQANDVLATLVDVTNLEKPKAFSGLSIRKHPEGEQYIVTEYMGPGCPDMFTKEVWMSCRSTKYVIALKIPINQEFDKKYICEVYDLDNDPLEMLNIKDIVDLEQQEIQIMLQKIRTRFDELKCNKDKFIEDLRNNKIIL